MKLLLPIIFFISLAACEMNLERPLKDDVIIIPEGQHSPEYKFKGFNDEELVFEARFDATARYSTLNPQNQSDINKLMGFSDCNNQHHENSARIGWRWHQNQLQIFSYVYKNEQRSFSYITSVPLNQFIRYKITKTQDGYSFTVGNAQPVQVERESCEGEENYILWPYFGGTEKAPHDIKIEIKFVEGTEGHQ